MKERTPAVFAVENDYQIMVPTDAPSLMWVEVGGKKYYDASNGIMRSLTEIHRMTVPMAALDAAGEYTVCERVIINRKPYFPEIEDAVRTTYAFVPVPDDGVRIYHIADAHNASGPCVAAALAFGPIDLLVLNGDIPNHSGEVERFGTIYEICAQVTGGRIPVVFARGNHDLRGACAERFADYTPSANGRTYYTFRLGSIWGVVLDCGEDKDDSNAEYGGTVACHAFREAEMEYLREMICRGDKEFDAPGVRYRLVIAHNPFTFRHNPPFNIEEELYTEWARMLREDVKPDLMLSGHLHRIELSMPGDASDAFGHPCPVVVGADPGRKAEVRKTFVGAGVTLSEDSIRVEFTDHDGNSRGVFSLKK